MNVKFINEDINLYIYKTNFNYIKFKELFIYSLLSMSLILFIITDLCFVKFDF